MQADLGAGWGAGALVRSPGVALTRSGFSVEGKVRVLGAVGSHDLFATDTLATVTAVRSGQPVVTRQVPVPATTTSRRSVVDLSLGGSLDLGTSGTTRLHAGVGTSRARVADDDPVYSSADLWSATLGVRTRVSALALSVGVRYERGTIDEVKTRVRPTGDVVRSGATVQSIGVVFAFAYDPGAAGKR